MNCVTGLDIENISKVTFGTRHQDSLYGTYAFTCWFHYGNNYTRRGTKNMVR